MSLFELLKVIVLGLVEGFTEWLPISSTGHMILVDEFIKLDVSEEFRSMFLVVIQLGAILAIVAMYFKRLNPWDKKKSQDKQKATWNLWGKIIIACLPAAVLGFLLDDWLDAHLYNGLVVAIMLILYGLAFILIENKNRLKTPSIDRIGQMDYRTAFYIGLFQVLALIPGTSRSGATILGAMILGCSRSVSAEFSFFLGVPVMLGASLLKIIKFGLHFTIPEVIYLLVGMAVAFFISIYAVGILLRWIKKNDFKVFGYYRIVLGIIVLVWYAISAIMGV